MLVLLFFTLASISIVTILFWKPKTKDVVETTSVNYVPRAQREDRSFATTRPKEIPLYEKMAQESRTQYTPPQKNSIVATPQQQVFSTLVTPKAAVITKSTSTPSSNVALVKPQPISSLPSSVPLSATPTTTTTTSKHVATPAQQQHAKAEKQTPIPSTPMKQIVTPSSTKKTPRSILKRPATDSVSKKRVAFREEDDDDEPETKKIKLSKRDDDDANASGSRKQKSGTKRQRSEQVKPLTPSQSPFSREENKRHKTWHEMPIEPTPEKQPTKSNTPIIVNQQQQQPSPAASSIITTMTIANTTPNSGNNQSPYYNTLQTPPSSSPANMIDPSPLSLSAEALSKILSMKKPSRKDMDFATPTTTLSMLRKKVVIDPKDVDALKNRTEEALKVKRTTTMHSPNNTSNNQQQQEPSTALPTPLNTKDHNALFDAVLVASNQEVPPTPASAMPAKETAFTFDANTSFEMPATITTAFDTNSFSMPTTTMDNAKTAVTSNFDMPSTNTATTTTFDFAPATTTTSDKPATTSTTFDMPSTFDFKPTPIDTIAAAPSLPAPTTTTSTNTSFAFGDPTPAAAANTTSTQQPPAAATDNATFNFSIDTLGAAPSTTMPTTTTTTSFAFDDGKTAATVNNTSTTSFAFDPTPASVPASTMPSTFNFPQPSTTTTTSTMPPTFNFDAPASSNTSFTDSTQLPNTSFNTNSTGTNAAWPQQAFNVPTTTTTTTMDPFAQQPPAAANPFPSADSVFSVSASQPTFAPFDQGMINNNTMAAPSSQFSFVSTQQQQQPPMMPMQNSMDSGNPFAQQPPVMSMDNSNPFAQQQQQQQQQPVFNPTFANNTANMFDNPFQQAASTMMQQQQPPPQSSFSMPNDNAFAFPSGTPPQQQQGNSFAFQSPMNNMMPQQQQQQVPTDVARNLFGSPIIQTTNNQNNGGYNTFSVGMQQQDNVQGISDFPASRQQQQATGQRKYKARTASKR